MMEVISKSFIIVWIKISIKGLAILKRKFWMNWYVFRGKTLKIGAWAENMELRANIKGAKTGIDSSNIDNSSFDVYPNPASDRIYVELLQKESSQISIYNSVGVNILSKNLSADNNEINISHLLAGIYLIELKSETQAI